MYETLYSTLVKINAMSFGYVFPTGHVRVRHFKDFHLFYVKRFRSLQRNVDLRTSVANRSGKNIPFW